MTTRSRKRASVYDLIAPPELDPLMKLSTAGVYADVGRDWLMDRIKDGSLPAHKQPGLKGEWRVRKSAIDALFPEVK